MLMRVCLITILLIAITILSLILAPRYLPEDHVLAKEGTKATQQIRDFIGKVKAKSSEALNNVEGKESDTQDTDTATSSAHDSHVQYPISREITDNKGRKIDVKITKIHEKDIVFVKKGSTKVFRFPIKDLSALDQEFITQTMDGEKETKERAVEANPFN